MAAVVCVLVAAGLASAGAGASAPRQCATDEDCELLGTCRGGACVCSPGFTGPSCGQLNLAPAGAATRGRVWPTAPQPIDGQLAWSFAPVFDPVTKRYNAVVEMACGHWGNQLSLWAVSSDRADGGYTLQRRLTSVGPNSAHLLRLDNGTYVMTFASMHVVSPPNRSAPVCDGNITVAAGEGGGAGRRAGAGAARGRAAPPPNEPVIPECGPGQQSRRDNCLSVHGGYYDVACTTYSAFTDSWPDGPWTVHCAVIEGRGWEPYNSTLFTIGHSNPAATPLQDGRALVAFRSHAAYWPSIQPAKSHGGGEHTGFALGPGLAGPFNVSGNLSWQYGNDEDPFVWQQPDGTLHCLYHNGRGKWIPNHGLHAFSRDGVVWHKPAGALDPACTQPPHACPAMYNNTVAFTDGTVEELTGRERPTILFDPETRRPIALFNGFIPSNPSVQWYAGAQPILSDP